MRANLGRESSMLKVIVVDVAGLTRDTEAIDIFQISDVKITGPGRGTVNIAQFGELIVFALLL